MTKNGKNGKNDHETLEIEVSIDYNLYFTIKVFAWGTADDPDHNNAQKLHNISICLIWSKK